MAQTVAMEDYTSVCSAISRASSTASTSAAVEKRLLCQNEQDRAVAILESAPQKGANPAQIRLFLGLNIGFRKVAKIVHVSFWHAGRDVTNETSQINDEVMHGQ
jgi:hypothetical protein